MVDTATVDTATVASIAVEERRHGTPPTGLERGRSSGLDGLRAFACLLVVAFHLHTVSGVSFGPLDPVIRGGDSGVWLFFALSGYLLYKPFVKGPVDVVGYGLKRAGRIVPGYFVALAGLTLITGSRLPIDHPLPFLTMSASYDIPLRGFLGNAWTLAAEVLFYVTLPWVARFAAGREIKVLAGLAVASMAAATAHRLVLNDSNAWLLGTYPLAFYAFVPGMLLAVMQVQRPATFAMLRSPAFLVIGATYLVFGALTTILPVALATGVGTALIMGFLLQHRLPFDRTLGFAGGASYALYLWHKDALIALGPVVGLAVTLVAAGLSWVLVERPILRWMHALAAVRRLTGPAEPALEQVAASTP